MTARHAATLPQIRAAWDAAAPAYDDHYGHAPSSTVEREAWLGLLLRILPGDRPLRVLDAGTGTGVVALLLAGAGHQVAGIDLASAMIARARLKAEAAAQRIAFVLGDAQDLPWADGTFDAVVSRYLLWTLPDPVRTLREWQRVVRPGGRIVAIDSLAPRPRPVSRVLGAVARLRRTAGGAAPPVTAPEIDAAAGFPLNSPRQPDPARDAFMATGLNRVRAVELRRLDATLQRAMPFPARWTRDYRRYLVSGFV